MSGYPRENFGHILPGRQGEKKSCSDIPLFGLYAYRYASNESVSRVDKPPLQLGTPYVLNVIQNLSPPT